MKAIILIIIQISFVDNCYILMIFAVTGLWNLFLNCSCELSFSERPGTNRADRYHL